MRINVETTFEIGKTRTRRPGRLSRPFRSTQPEGFGLLLEDAKSMLWQLQDAILLDQIQDISEARRTCPDCNRVRAIHDYRPRVLDTLFGRFHVKAPRIRRCACNAKSDVAFGGPLSPLAHFFPNRATPELQRLQAELGARHSFREAAHIMETFLPCPKQTNTSVRNRLGKTVEEIIDSEYVAPAVSSAGNSAAPVTVFLDGAHVRCRPEYQKRHLDVVVGKVESVQMCRRFGLVQQAAQSPSRQLRHDLKAIGWDGDSPVTVISGGEPALPNLVRLAVGGPVRHILDWWHISVRVKHVENAVKGLVQAKNFPGIPVLFERPAERLRWSPKGANRVAVIRAAVLDGRLTSAYHRAAA